MYSRFVRNFLRYVARRKSLEYLAILEKTQWLKREEIVEIQRQRLRALIEHAYFKVPYYHMSFKERGLTPDDMKNKNDLAKLPILTKEKIRKNFSDLIARDFPTTERIPGSTGS